MQKKYIAFLLLSISFFFACQPEEQTQDNTSSPALFVEKASNASGINFSNELRPSTDLNILEYLYYYNGGGVAIGDINQDGLEDVLLTANESQDKLFLNKGNLQFEDITKKSGIKALTTWSTGATMDDVNGDGLLDIYICKVAPVSGAETHNLLYLNNGDETFTESAAKYGLDFSGYSTQASFFDYDQDGDLDVYLLNHSVHSVRSYGKINKRNQKDELSGDRLLENRINEAEGTFVDVTEQAGIYSSAIGYGLGVMTTDINNDGLPDIYVGNDFHENDYIYINNGNKTFTESMSSMLSHSSKFTMGVDIADMNDDGLMDIFTTDMLPYDEAVALKSGGEDTDQVFKIREEFGFEDQYARNHFQLQQAGNQFADIALMTNTYATDWSWSVLLQDFDNDGKSDIFISNGIVKRPNDLDYIKFVNNREASLTGKLPQEELDAFLNAMPAQKLNNLLFLQNEDLVFSDIAEQKVGPPTFSNGAAYADFDKDGDLDLLVNNINANASLLENTSQGKNNFVAFELKNKDTQKTLKGTSVEVFYNQKSKKQIYTTTRGYQSSSSHVLHFGLGNETKLDSVVIVWANQTKEVFEKIGINQHHKIDKSENAKPYQFPKIETTSKSLSVLAVKHSENKFDDYNADKLIPELLSREGPAVVYEDFNQDGKKDLFIGGARFQKAKFLFQQKNGFVEQKANIDFEKDKKYEDVAAAAIDFDKDGDLDLYVVSGGNDEKELNKNLEDRLYLNDGKGNFQRLPLSLPHTNGSTVAVGDYDNDGFDDLFIGARSIPVSYGLSPFSFILRNQEGFGIELVKKERFGMITHSEWADIDNDKDLDLVICGDWMNISVLENQGNGEFQYKSKEIGLGESAGLWNTFYLKDLNDDGKLDIIAGNVGSNFKWKASPEKPMKLYVMDLDKNGQTEPLIFQHYFSKYMPAMSLDKLVAQVPSVRKQFVSYAEYAKVQSIEDFNQVKKEDIVEEKELKELRSMVYLSQGQNYVGTPLPQMAQMSTIQGFEMDEQGRLLFVGNHFDYLTELGKSASNSGGLFSKFDAVSGTFQNYEALPLPHKLNTRGITAIGNNQYLITCNNSVQYILKK